MVSRAGLGGAGLGWDGLGCWLTSPPSSHLSAEGWVFAHERCGDQAEEEALDAVHADSGQPDGQRGGQPAAGQWISMAWRVRPCGQPFQVSASSTPRETFSTIY